MSYLIAKSRYQRIKKRSFESFIDLFLVCTYLDDKILQNANEANFALFDYNNARIPEALTAYQLGKNSAVFHESPVSELDKVIDNWYKTHDLTSYKLLFLDKVIPEEKFQVFYGSDEIDRECHFCKMKETEIEKLILNKQIKTKRLSTRGTKMEVDRLSPNDGYVEGNIVLCCYWCNNAKTDEFTAEEFEPIGNFIGQIFQNRLNK
jgi:hypothetical protein